MREKIHPEYYQSKVSCACGNEFVVGATVKEIRLDICSNCHPFFTGKQKFVDTAGRVDKYFRKYGEDAQKKYKKKKKRRVVKDEADLQALLADDSSILDAVAVEVAETEQEPVTEDKETGSPE